MNFQIISRCCPPARAILLGGTAIAAAACVGNTAPVPTVGGAADTGADNAVVADLTPAGTDDVTADGASEASTSPDTAIVPDTAIADAVATDATPTDALADSEEVTATDSSADAAPDGVADATAETAADTAPTDATDASPDVPVDPPKPGLAAPCDTDDDCAGAGTGKKCDLASHSCVLCLSSKDCVAGELC
ncbi:MAG: hypothetical protein FJ100_08300 [Deltaproteobacteria bacterium]|nr:hypothetical protein [Deltaproteobacteria bacterium]